MRNPIDQAAGGKFVGAVENALKILRYLAHAAHPLGVAPIARETNLNVSTTFNILRTLSKEGLVSFDKATKTYRIALGVLEFSAPLLGANQADLIRPVLEELSAGHSALIGLWKITPSDRIVLVDRVVGVNVVRIDISIGSRLPVFVGAVGRSIAATRNLSRSELEAEFRSLRWENPPNFETYADDVAQAAKRGYATDFGLLFKGVDIVASTICDHSGVARLGISGIAIAGQLSARQLDALGTAIAQACDHVGRNLYGRALARAETMQAATSILARAREVAHGEEPDAG